jgi:predicted  nucleic acid-binding Zn-ribbon protein
MADKCKKCGGVVFARFADLTGGLCPRCAGETSDQAKPIPEKVRRIVTDRRIPIGFDVAKPQSASSYHGQNARASLTQPAQEAKPKTPSSYHVSETAEPETRSESYSVNIGVHVTPTMMEQLRNAAQLRLASVPELIREAIRALLTSES